VGYSETDTGNVLRIASQFYDAATGTITWPQALVSLERLFRMQGAILERHDLANGCIGEYESSGLPDQGLSDWTSHFSRICPRLKHVAGQQGGTVSVDYDFIGESEIGRNELYQDFLRPYGLRYFLTSNLRRDTRYHTTLALQRSIDQGHASDHEMELMKLLTPHLQRALSIREMIARGGQKIASYESTLDALTVGIIVLSDKGIVEFINAAADSVLSAQNHFRLEGRRLSFTDDLAQKKYTECLSGLTRGIQSVARAVTTRSLPSAKGSRKAPALSEDFLKLKFVPIPPQTRFASALCRNDALQSRLMVVVSNPKRSSLPESELLQQFYDLTPAQAKLALAIAEGQDLRSYSNRQGITFNTARTHMAGLRQRLDARNQVDVVRIIRSLQSAVA